MEPARKASTMGKYKSNLQAMRKRAGFKSAREFAEHAGVNVKTYTKHEQGDVSMSLLQAWEYADLLNCTLDELAGRRSPNGTDNLTSDEQTIVDAYRVTDERQRERLLSNAKDELEYADRQSREKKEAV